MASNLPPAARTDKALARQFKQFEETLDNADDFLGAMCSAAERAPLEKRRVDLRKRMATALEGEGGRKAAQAAAALQKEAVRLLDEASFASRLELARRQWQELHDRTRGLLAQALVEVAKIEPAALRLPLQKEQAELKAEFDRATQASELLKGIAALEPVAPRVEALLKRLRPYDDAAAWMRSTYRPLLARVTAGLQRVPGDRARKTLLAELDFVEVDTQKALGRCDMKAVQTRIEPQLQRIEKLAVRLIALSPALDRELARLAKLSGSVDGGLVGQLRGLIQAKASGWPAGASLDDMERATIAFESELAKLAARFEKAARAAPARA